MKTLTSSSLKYIPWNKGKLIGQRPPLKQREIWSIRTRLQLASETRDLAMFNLAIDSKLRSCDLVKLRVRDISNCGSILKRAMVMQQKTKQPVQFEITEQTRESLKDLIKQDNLNYESYLLEAELELQNIYQLDNIQGLLSLGWK